MLTARQIMRQPVRTIQPAESVAHAVREMQACRVSCLIVLPRFEGDEYGIITKTDVIEKVVARGRDPGRVPVSAVMTRPLHSVSPDVSLRQCAALMLNLRVGRLPVCDERGRPIGVVSDAEVYDALLGSQLDAAPSRSL